MCGCIDSPPSLCITANNGINCGCRRVSAEQGGQKEVRWHVRVHPMRLLLYFLPIGMYVLHLVCTLLIICTYIPFVWVVVFDDVMVALCFVVLVERGQVSRSGGAHAGVPVDRRLPR